MEVTGHAATGAAGGAMLGLLPGVVPSTFDLVLTTIGCAGMALLPDIDHPKATAAQTFGWPSKLIARIIETVSGWIYLSTRTGRDQVRQGGHRTLTHTALFASSMGILTYFAATKQLAALIILFIALCWGIRGFFPKTLSLAKKEFVPRWLKKILPKGSSKLLLYCMALVVPLGMYTKEFPMLSPMLLALIVGWGSFIHSLGDCLTNSGAPLLYPLPIRGQLWYRFKAPARFSTGSAYGKLIERRIKWLCFFFIVFIYFIRWYAL